MGIFVKYFSLMWDIVLLELDGDSIIYQYKKKMLVAQLWSEPTAHSEMRRRLGSHKNRGHFQQKVNKKIPRVSGSIIFSFIYINMLQKQISV